MSEVFDYIVLYIVHAKQTDKTDRIHVDAVTVSRCVLDNVPTFTLDLLMMRCFRNQTLAPMPSPN